MFREMRRNRQQLSEEESLAVLERGTSGVLAVLGDEGYPYAVPLSYVYRNGKIYFHCAKSGHKLEALKHCGKVSFCVVDQDQVKPEEYTTYFLQRHRFRKCPDPGSGGGKEGRGSAAGGKKYCPSQRDGWQEAIDREWKALCMVEIRVEHMTGKQARELA